jgi:hypothetical protein
MGSYPKGRQFKSGPRYQLKEGVNLKRLTPYFRSSFSDHFVDLLLGCLHRLIDLINCFFHTFI